MKYIDDNTNIVQDATDQNNSRGLFWWLEQIASPGELNQTFIRIIVNWVIRNVPV